VDEQSQQHSEQQPGQTLPEGQPPAEQDTEAPRVNRKQRILESRGQTVPIDLFLYSCLEQERLLRAKGEENLYVIRWPLLGSGAEPQPSPELEGMQLQGLMTRLIVWYRDTYPALTVTGAIDHELLHEVVEPLVSMNLDLARLYRLKTSEELPAFDKSVGNNRFWDDLESDVRTHFPQHGAMFLRYIHWSHAAEPVQDFEIGDVPPVGRNAPRLPRRDRDDRGGRGGPRGGGDRGGRGGDRGGPRGGGMRDRGPRSGGGDRDRGPRGGGSGDRDRGPRGENSFAGGDRDRGPRGGGGDRDRGPRGGGGDRDRGPRGPRRDGGEADPKLEAAALADVQDAIKRLASEPGLDEVTLKPANSFYRRIQHQNIVDAGYSSFSVGEGSERAVKVSRKQ
jgi:hypothetical protein